MSPRYFGLAYAAALLFFGAISVGIIFGFYAIGLLTNQVVGAALGLSLGCLSIGAAVIVAMRTTG